MMEEVFLHLSGPNLALQSMVQILADFATTEGVESIFFVLHFFFLLNLLGGYILPTYFFFCFFPHMGSSEICSTFERYFSACITYSWKCAGCPKTSFRKWYLIVKFFFYHTY